jgi:hypothetical protein
MLNWNRVVRTPWVASGREETGYGKDIYIHISCHKTLTLQVATAF